MKTSFPSPFFRFMSLLIAGMMVLVLPSCHDEVTSTHTYRTMVPVYLEMSTIRAKDIVVAPPQELENPGKIYIYGDYLFVNEPQKGIHILDNSNPSNPINVNFIKIDGNVDLAINSGILYADSYVDLLAFDINDIRNVKLENRVQDVFKSMYHGSDTGIILSYKDTVMTVDSNQMWHWGRPWEMFSTQRSDSFAAMTASSQSYGQGGSMARFTLMSGHLFAVDDYSLRVFDVLDAKLPKHLKNINLGWGIETIFPFQDKLFIGSNTGMHIYDAKIPSDPKEMAVYQHIRACDPVVVNEKHAFVTLRTGQTCNGVNELHVVDIQNPRNPTLLKAYPMLNPHGLSLSGKYLYVAEGRHGLKSFDVGDVMEVTKNQLEFLQSMKSVDIIAGPKSLIVIGPDGVCQFDYSTPSVLKPLSCIKVKNPVVV